MSEVPVYVQHGCTAIEAPPPRLAPSEVVYTLQIEYTRRTLGGVHGFL